VISNQAPDGIILGEIRNTPLPESVAIVFDSFHWQYREDELIRFLKEFDKSGRPVCVLVCNWNGAGREFPQRTLFKQLAELNHAIELTEAEELGDHLNNFLRHYGKQRERWQWERFYRDHTVRYLEGTAAFWVTLSFWIQGQYDLSESIQEWMYRCFKQHAVDRGLQEAILRIAALSTERLPLPEVLLPHSKGAWPARIFWLMRGQAWQPWGLCVFLQMARSTGPSFMTFWDGF